MLTFFFFLPRLLRLHHKSFGFRSYTFVGMSACVCVCAYATRFLWAAASFEWRRAQPVQQNFILCLCMRFYFFPLVLFSFDDFRGAERTTTKSCRRLRRWAAHCVCMCVCVCEPVLPWRTHAGGGTAVGTFDLQLRLCCVILCSDRRSCGFLSADSIIAVSFCRKCSIRDAIIKHRLNVFSLYYYVFLLFFFFFC